MKKLIAMIGAVAMAFGLYADTPAPAPEDNYYSTSFEAADDGVDGKTWNAAAADWTTEQTEAFTLDDQLEKSALPYATGRDRRDDLFKGLAANINYLKLETGTNTLEHGVAAGQVYFDQLVKFTGYEEDPTLADGTKIAVWLSAIEEEDYVPAGTDEEGNAIPASGTQGSTNLYVSVGTGNVGDPITKVQIAGDFEVDQWYRVTIKSIGDVSSGLTSQLGFQLFIDGAAASIVEADKDYNVNSESFTDAAAALYDKGQLFTAITMADLTLTKVAYQGIGGVDDIIFSQEAPDFDSKVEFTIDAVPGVDVAKVVGPDGVDQTVSPYSVMPGSLVKIYITAKDGWRLDYPNAYIEKTVSQAGKVSIAAELEGKVVKCVVQVVNAADLTKTNLYAEAELGVVLTGLKTGDTATVLENCEIQDKDENTLFSFTANTTVAVPAANVWNIFIANETATAGGSLIDNVGLFVGKTVSVTFDEMIDGDIEKACALFVYGAIDGNITAANNGIVYIDADGIGGSTLAGTINAANIVVGGDVTFSDSGKIVSATDLTAFEDNFLPVGKVVITEDAGTYTAQIPAAPTTGFMVIIAAGGTKGPFETLAEAVEAAEAGDTIQLLSDETVTGICTITKSITLDLNGKTLSKADTTTAASKMIVVCDNATLTIDGTKDGSAAVGGFYAGKKVGSTGNNGNIVVNGGTYSWPGDACVFSSNGMCTDSDITINNATVTSGADIALYFAADGDYAINNSTITGYTAIYQKAGTLAIDADSVITATGDTYIAPKPNTNGADKTGDAIVLDSNKSYAGDVELAIASGATVTKTATGAAAIRETVTSGNESSTLKIAAGDVTDIAVTDSFAEKVAAGHAELPGFVAVAGGKAYATLAAAVEADGDVTLLTNVTLTETLSIDTAKAINLAGKTITFGDGIGDGIVFTDADGVISNGTITSTLTARNNGLFIDFCRANGLLKDLTLDATNFKWGIGGDLGDDEAWKQIVDAPEFTVVCENVDVSGSWSVVQAEGVNLTLDAGCKVRQTGTPGLDQDEWRFCAIHAGFNAVITINGGTYTAEHHAICKMTSPAKIYVNGGTFTGNLKNYPTDENRKQYGDDVWELNGGDFNSAFVFDAPVAIIPGDSTATFDRDASAYCEEGYETVLDEASGRYVVAEIPAVPVANVTIGGVTTPYTDLHAALVDGSVAGAAVELITNVDLDGVDWAPVANFQGTFDGQGYKVSNLTVDVDGNNVGMFGAGFNKETVVKNLTLENISVTGAQYVGGVVADGSSAIVSNVTVCGAIQITGAKYVGAISGHAGVKLVDCHVIGDKAATTVIGSATAAQVGGIVGMLPNTCGGCIFDCTVEGVTVLGAEHVGGIVGRAIGDTEVVRCEVEDVIVKDGGETAGAIIGQRYANGAGDTTTAVWMLNCTATDTVLVDATGAEKTFAMCGAYFENNKTFIASSDAVAEDLVYDTAWKAWGLTGGTYEVGNATAVTVLGQAVAEGYEAVDNQDGTYTVQLKPTDITVTVKKTDAIASVTYDNVALEFNNNVATLTLPAETTAVTLTLAAVDTIKIPVFTFAKGAEVVGWNTTGKETSYEVAADDTLNFSAEEANAQDPAITDKAAADAVADAATTQAGKDKVTALTTTGPNPVGGKDLANWINTKAAGDVDAALAGDYVKASIALDVAPITEKTDIEIKDLSTGANGALTFAIDIADETMDTEAQLNAIKDMVKATSDVTDWTTTEKQLEVTAVPNIADGTVTVTPKAATDKAFMKVVIPPDTTK